MKTGRRFTAAIVAMLAAALDQPSARADPDIENGKAIVVGAVEGESAQAGQPQPCMRCHGVDGVGDGTGAFPRLSGQAAFYMYKQLLDYASGARPNEIMSPIAKALTEAQMEDVAAYYASIEDAPYFPPPEVDGPTLQHGAKLSAVGSTEKAIPACVNCHGPNGTGWPPSFPYLAGQYASYTQLELNEWRQGKRNNDPLNVMEDIAKRMSDEDIRAVALYFESVRPLPAKDR